MRAQEVELADRDAGANPASRPTSPLDPRRSAGVRLPPGRRRAARTWHRCWGDPGAADLLGAADLVAALEPARPGSPARTGGAPPNTARRQTKCLDGGWPSPTATDAESGLLVLARLL